MSLITLHVMKWLKLVRYTPIVGAQLDELRQLSAFLFLSLCRCSASVNVFALRMVIKCLLPGCLAAWLPIIEYENYTWYTRTHWSICNERSRKSNINNNSKWKCDHKTTVANYEKLLYPVANEMKATQTL